MGAVPSGKHEREGHALRIGNGVGSHTGGHGPRHGTPVLIAIGLVLTLVGALFIRFSFRPDRGPTE